MIAETELTQSWKDWGIWKTIGSQQIHPELDDALILVFVPTLQLILQATHAKLYNLWFLGSTVDSLLGHGTME